MNPLIFLFLKSDVILNTILSSKEHGFKTHLVEQSCIGVGVAERIDLPSNAWLLTEFLEDPFLTIHHVLNHIFIDGSGLVMHGPTSINDLKLSTIDEPFHLDFHVISLFLIPHFEESHFNLRESSARISE